MQYPHRRRVPGFTLIEVLIALAVLGILAAIALPVYQQHLQRSRRADAQAVLAALSQAQERYRSNNTRYADSLAALGFQAPAASRYRFAVDLASASGYEIHAYPKDGDAQAADTACADMFVRMEAGRLDHLDKNPASVAARPACWPR